MIYCANNNTLYERAADICADLGVDKGNISKVLAGKLRRVKDHCFCELCDDAPDKVAAARRQLLYSNYSIILPEEFENPPPRIYGGDIDD